MKVANANRTCDMAVENAVRKSVIHATPQMFRMFFDGLYTDKPLAIVRELISNAWDSHYRAGKLETPITIHLPTAFTPHLEIKDFGTGLAPADVESLYMDIGNSDKTDTDDEIGGFGSGSKSPFAYTDQFTVESRFEGKIYFFQAMLQADGTPGCVLLGEHDTDEPNGLTIRVPVENTGRKHQYFREALDKISPYLPVTPNTNADYRVPNHAPDFSIPCEIPGSSITRVDIRTPSRHHRWRGHKIVQGIVPYPLDLGTHRSLLHDLEQTVRQVFSTRDITIHTSINSVPVVGGREQLSFSSDGIAKTQKIINETAQTIVKHFEKQIATTSKWYEWMTARTQLPIKTPVPQRFEEFCFPNGQLRAHSLVPGETERSMPHFEIRHIDGPRNRVKTTPQDCLFFQEIPKYDIVVVPSTPWPINKYLKEVYYPTHHSTNNRVIVLYGATEQIRARVEALGLPNQVIEAEHVKAAKSAGGAKRFGSTQYSTTTYNLTGDDQRLNYTSTKFTAGAMLADDGLWPNHIIALQYKGDYFPVGDIRQACANDWLRVTEGYTHITQIVVPDNHTRVYKALEKHFKGRLITKDSCNAISQGYHPLLKINLHYFSRLRAMCAIAGMPTAELNLTAGNSSFDRALEPFEGSPNAFGRLHRLRTIIRRRMPPSLNSGIAADDIDRRWSRVNRILGISDLQQRQPPQAARAYQMRMNALIREADKAFTECEALCPDLAIHLGRYVRRNQPRYDDLSCEARLRRALATLLNQQGTTP